MRAIAIVPARGNSKGVPRKNMRFILGTTLLERTIKHAQDAKIKEIYVTSENDEILKHAEECGAETITRPESLSTDTANGDLVAVHALESIGITRDNVPEDHVTLFLQPTSPLRPSGVIQECLHVLGGLDWNYDSVFTAYDGHFAWHIDPKSFLVSHEGRYVMTPMPPWSKRVMRQDIDRTAKVYIENGCVYATRTSEYLKLRTDPTEWSKVGMPNRLCGRIGVVEMNKADSIDIDTEYDLWIAEQRLVYLMDRKELAV